MFNRALLLLFCAAVLFAGGCAPFQQAPEHVLSAEDTVRADVPFVAQAGTHDCGPAALASLLKYHGRDVSLEEVTENVYIPAARRTILPDMENYARHLGLETSSGRGSIELLKKNLDAGKPAIILVEAGSGIVDTPHYIVIWGYTPQGFLAHAGEKPNVFMDFKELDRRWKKMNRLYLVIEE